MSDQDDAKKPEELKDLEPTEDPKGGVLIGLNQPTLVPAVQLPAVQLPGAQLGVENPTRTKAGVIGEEG